MANLEKNDLFQDRGVFKLTDGTRVIEITSKGELKVIEGNLSSLTQTLGDQKYLFVSDINGVFKDILTELKINNRYLQEIVGERLTSIDLEE